MRSGGAVRRRRVGQIAALDRGPGLAGASVAAADRAARTRRVPQRMAVRRSGRPAAPGDDPVWQAAARADRPLAGHRPGHRPRASAGRAAPVRSCGARRSGRRTRRPSTLAAGLRGRRRLPGTGARPGRRTRATRRGRASGGTGPRTGRPAPAGRSGVGHGAGGGAPQRNSYSGSHQPPAAALVRRQRQERRGTVTEGGAWARPGRRGIGRRRSQVPLERRSAAARIVTVTVREDDDGLLGLSSYAPYPWSGVGQVNDHAAGQQHAGPSRAAVARHRRGARRARYA